MADSGTITLGPAPPRLEEGGGGGRWAWLLTAQGIVEAELVRGVLESAGVPVVLDRRDPSPFAWMYLAANVNAPVRVLVPAGLLDTARLHLLEAGIEGERVLGSTPEKRPPPAPERSLAFRVLQAVLTIAVLLVAGWIVLITMAGRATCMLKLFC
jgi:hypothetical protein